MKPLMFSAIRYHLHRFERGEITEEELSVVLAAHRPCHLTEMLAASHFATIQSRNLALLINQALSCHSRV